MKKKFLIGGHLKIEYDNFISLLKSFLTASKVNDRYASDVEKTIKYEDEDINIYIYEDDEKHFLFDAEYRGSNKDVEDFMNDLNNTLTNNGISYFQFQWSEYDDDDNEIGEEFEIKYPADDSLIT